MPSSTMSGGERRVCLPSSVTTGILYSIILICFWHLQKACLAAYYLHYNTQLRGSSTSRKLLTSVFVHLLGLLLGP